jgi:phosphatidylglycerophosphatase A
MLLTPFFKRLLTSCFGLGRLPLAPGTWGSLLSAVAFGAVYYSGGSGVAALVIMILFFVAGSIICVKFSDAAVAATGKADPNEVVADEIAGQALTFMALPFFFDSASLARQVITITVMGFFLFRLFDTIKPWPSYRLEELHGGWGILADDLMAGVYAGATLFIAAKFWILK